MCPDAFTVYVFAKWNICGLFIKLPVYSVLLNLFKVHLSFTHLHIKIEMIEIEVRNTLKLRSVDKNRFDALVTSDSKFMRTENIYNLLQIYQNIVLSNAIKCIMSKRHPSMAQMFDFIDKNTHSTIDTNGNNNNLYIMFHKCAN